MYPICLTDSEHHYVLDENEPKEKLSIKEILVFKMINDKSLLILF